jgi:hypothetical protein
VIHKEASGFAAWLDEPSVVTDGDQEFFSNLSAYVSNKASTYRDVQELVT